MYKNDIEKQLKLYGVQSMTIKKKRKNADYRPRFKTSFSSQPLGHKKGIPPTLLDGM